MERQQEYESLRNEMLTVTNYEKNYETLMYTAVLAVITYSATQNEPLMFLLPTIIVIPIYWLSRKQLASIAKLGMYILVFHEDSPGWETVLLEYDRKYHKKKFGEYSYLLMSICGPIMCIIVALSNYNINTNRDIGLSIASIVFNIYFIYKKRVDLKEAKEAYFKNWTEIKKSMNER